MSFSNILVKKYLAIASCDYGRNYMGPCALDQSRGTHGCNISPPASFLSCIPPPSAIFTLPPASRLPLLFLTFLTFWPASRLPLFWWWAFPHPRRFCLHFLHPTPVFQQHPATLAIIMLRPPASLLKSALRLISSLLPPPFPNFSQHPASKMHRPPCQRSCRGPNRMSHSSL